MCVYGFPKQLALIATAGITLGAGIGIGQRLIGHSSSGTIAAAPLLTATAEANPTAPASERSSDERNTIAVVKEVSPTVVTITSGEGLGSGVIIDGKQGIILTNNHVIAEAPGGQVDVTLKNAKTLRGQVLGTDRDVDIAVVKVNASGLPQAELADSDRLDVGQTAIAIGAPLGLEQTVTHGVVSTLNRKINPDQVEGYIQTDAAINPGNSGGPLIDSSGHVIGINSAVLRGNEAQSLGFAIPINVARDVAHQILSGGNAHRAFLAIQPRSITPELAEQFQLPVSTGVIVWGISRELQTSARIYAGDLITSVDGKRIGGSGDLLRIVRAKRPGEIISLGIRRPDGPVTIKVRLGGQ